MFNICHTISSSPTPTTVSGTTFNNTFSSTSQNSPALEQIIWPCLAVSASKSATDHVTTSGV